jgi:MoaA/NifB/PqqE/SkfB family radical SAM enzyme
MPAEPSGTRWKVNPFLHVGSDRIYNPLTDVLVTAADHEFARVRAFLAGAADADETLARDGWAVEQGIDLSRSYLLRVVSLETMTACNQKCWFCPVSAAPREDFAMPDSLFDDIVGQLTAFRRTLRSVFLQGYNEPTIDRRFVERCGTLMSAGLPVAVLSNGSGLTPATVDALVDRGGLRYLGINLSTLDRRRYQHDRGADHLQLVLRNLDYARDRPLADEMRIEVLGTGNTVHTADFEAIRDRFAGTRFVVERHDVMDRAGWLAVGRRPEKRVRRLAGCENIGSRPLQHLHITASGKCILCCEDYDENHVVGDLNDHTIVEILEGPDLARLRRWVYGIEEAPDDFMCRNCIYALKGEG